MEKLKGIMLWILMALAIIVLGLMAWSAIRGITSKKGDSAAALDEQVKKAQLNYYSLGSAEAVANMTSDLPPTNSTQQFRPI